MKHLRYGNDAKERQDMTNLMVERLMLMLLILYMTPFWNRVVFQFQHS